MSEKAEKEGKIEQAVDAEVQKEVAEALPVGGKKKRVMTEEQKANLSRKLKAYQAKKKRAEARGGKAPARTKSKGKAKARPAHTPTTVAGYAVNLQKRRDAVAADLARIDKKLARAKEALVG